MSTTCIRQPIRLWKSTSTLLDATRRHRAPNDPEYAEATDRERGGELAQPQRSVKARLLLFGHVMWKSAMPAIADGAQPMANSRCQS